MSSRVKSALLATAAMLALQAGSALAEPLSCNLSAYSAGSGPIVSAADGDLSVTWAGEPGNQVRLRLGLENATPTIRDLSIKADGDWVSVASKATPDFSVVSGVRRMSFQQMDPLNDLKIPLTTEVLAKYRWDPFWDAPLDLAPPTRAGNPPPPAGVPAAGQPGIPRDPSEVKRASAVYAVKGCDVRTDGERVEISFPGVTLGVFSGKLMYTLYKGSNLVRQEIVAATNEQWVAYKYDAGLKGMALGANSQVAWRDISNTWQGYGFGGAVNTDKTPLLAANRLMWAQGAGGSIAAFPPPHKFFWAREVSINVGYNWYRKDSDGSFGFGIRQNEREDYSEDKENWALYSARPGTQQLMPVYLYPSLGPAKAAAGKAMAFTRGDVFRALPGYQVMNHHYHMDIGDRWIKEGVNTQLPDLEAIKATGITIVSPIFSTNFTGFSGANPDADPAIAAEAATKNARPRANTLVATIAASVEGARLHSDKNFLIMPNQELYGGPLGGHSDLLFSHPVYWDQRKTGQPFIETSEKYGKVYHIGSAKDLMDMAKAEDVMISMPHPRSKGSTGYPDAIKDRDYFNDAHFQGFGFRWGMGLDGSEKRTCEYRCLPLLDDLSNWVVDRNEPLKYATSISEVRHQAPGDDIYASAPVTYVKLAQMPRDPAPVVAALMKGDSFVTTGEVLISNYAVEINGKNSKVIADVEWTFPLDMVEIVWGDGKTTGRQVISATNLPPFGTHRFEIPFDAKGKKWIRFAAWDSASEGAFTQPSRLQPIRAAARK